MEYSYQTKSVAVTNLTHNDKLPKDKDSMSKSQDFLNVFNINLQDNPADTHIIKTVHFENINDFGNDEHKKSKAIEKGPNKDCMENVEYLKPGYTSIPREKIERLFKEIHKDSLNENLLEIIGLYDHITSLNLEDANKNIDIRPKVGPLSTLPYMVDCSVVPNRRMNTEKIILDQISILDKYIYRWRRVAGDGNCFYRAVMFSYLESIILTRNSYLMKKMIVEIYQKFSVNYEKSKMLNEKTRQAIHKTNKQLIIKILILLYELMINSKNITQIFSDEDSVQSAYQTLLYCFVFCKDFDLGIIQYFRYLFFEFIEENKEKIYSKDFPVKIGNLLPEQYETEKGEFLYKKFYEDFLLKMYTDAEKIVIYLTPFILNVKLKVLMYEFHKDYNIQEKDFSEFLETPDYDIVLLYKGDHYDIVYEANIEKYLPILEFYKNTKERLRYISPALLDVLNTRKNNKGSDFNFIDQINFRDDGETQLLDLGYSNEEKGTNPIDSHNVLSGIFSSGGKPEESSKSPNRSMHHNINYVEPLGNSANPNAHNNFSQQFKGQVSPNSRANQAADKSSNNQTIRNNPNNVYNHSSNVQKHQSDEPDVIEHLYNKDRIIDINELSLNSSSNEFENNNRNYDIQIERSRSSNSTIYDLFPNYSEVIREEKKEEKKINYNSTLPSFIHQQNNQRQEQGKTHENNLRNSPPRQQVSKNTSFQSKVSVTCADCKQIYFPTQDIYLLCNNCIYTILSLSLSERFFKYQKEAFSMYKSGNENSLQDFYNQIMFNFLKIQGNYTNVFNLSSLIGKDVREIIVDLKRDFCLVCNNDGLRSQKNVQLPCGCTLCSPRCVSYYFTIIFSSYAKKNFICLCSTELSAEGIRNVYNLSKSYQSEVGVQGIRNIFKFMFTSRCMACCSSLKTTKGYTDENISIVLRDLQVSSTGNFLHYLCQTCYYSSNGMYNNSGNIFLCMICNLKHTIVKVESQQMGAEECRLM